MRLIEAPLLTCTCTINGKPLETSPCQYHDAAADLRDPRSRGRAAHLWGVKTMWSIPNGLLCGYDSNLLFVVFINAHLSEDLHAARVHADYSILCSVLLILPVLLDQGVLWILPSSFHPRSVETGTGMSLARLSRSNPLTLVAHIRCKITGKARREH